MKAEYDTIANALYLTIKKGRVAKTIKMHDRLLVDVDKKGDLVGIEILDARSQLGSSGKKPLTLNVTIPAISL